MVSLLRGFIASPFAVAGHCFMTLFGAVATLLLCCVALLRGIVAWHCCVSSLRGFAAWHCCVALLSGFVAWLLLRGFVAWLC